MEFIGFITLFFLSLILAYHTGIATDYMMDKLAHFPRLSDRKPTYLFGKICGTGFGIFGFFLCSIYAGPYGPLWGVLAASIAFPLFAFSIFAYVRIREFVEDALKEEGAF